MKLRGSKNVYEEIAEQYRNYIRLGVVSDGEKLPSCRELAMELGINPNTVERAYSLLEKEGFVVTLPKKGTFAVDSTHHKTDLVHEAERMIQSLRAAGLSRQDLVNIMKDIYQEDDNT